MIFISDTEPKTTEKLEKENQELREKWNYARAVALISTALLVYFSAQKLDTVLITPLRNLIASYTQLKNKKQDARHQSGLENRTILLQDSGLEESPITIATRESTLVNIAHYWIKPGDTLSEIAERNETKYNLEQTTEEIIKLNNIIIGCSYQDQGSYGDFDRLAEDYNVSWHELEKMVNSIPESERNRMRLITDPNSIQARQIILIPKFE